MKDGKFEAEDFEKLYDCSDPDYTAAQIANALLEAEREKAPVVYASWAFGEPHTVAWGVKTDRDTHTARLVDIREVGE